MEKDLNIKGAWMTVNRACNMRCSWCYANETQFHVRDSMNFSLAQKIVDFCADACFEGITLIGGEPTIWSDLFRLCDYIKSKGMKISLVTNGLRFHEDAFVKKIINSGIESISFSLKSGNEQQHRDLTKTNTFDAIGEATQKITAENIDVNFSIVVSSLVIDNLEEIITTAAKNGGKSFSLEFCSTTFNGAEPSKGYMITPKEAARSIAEQYERLCIAAGNPVFIEQALPGCVWPEGFLRKLWQKGQMSVGCHVMDRSGIIFDPLGKVIPCNCLSGASLGQIGADFDDVLSFQKFWYSEPVEAFYRQITSYPSQSCGTCDTYVNCGGGCPLQWFVYNPDDVISGQIANFTKEEEIVCV